LVPPITSGSLGMEFSCICIMHGDGV
jgi:hypothetical protein